MGFIEPEHSLGKAYNEQLIEQYGEKIAAPFACDWKQAELSQQSGETIPYVRIGQQTIAYGNPVMYVPGFTEGIAAKAPFAAEMAMHGFDFILPGQNRKQILKNTLDKKDATYSQAVNYLAVLDSEGLSNETVDVITHSYGDLIFQAMLKIANARGQTMFKRAKLIALAPAGSNNDENIVKLAARTGRSLVSEGRTDKDFHDPGGAMMKAGAKNLLINIPRSIREVGELSRNRMDYGELAASGLKSITVLGYAEDKIFPHRVIEVGMQEAFEHGVSYATPYSLQKARGGLRGGNGASHNDEQFTPSRVALAAAQILRAA